MWEHITKLREQMAQLEQGFRSVGPPIIYVGVEVTPQHEADVLPNGQNEAPQEAHEDHHRGSHHFEEGRIDPTEQQSRSGE